MSYELLSDDTDARFAEEHLVNSNVSKDIAQRAGRSCMHSNPQSIFPQPNVRTDEFGRSVPFVKGIKGNIYESGPSSTDMAALPEFRGARPSYMPTPLTGRPNGVEVKYEDFEMIKNTTPIPSDTNPYILMVLIVLALLAANYWLQGGTQFLQNFFNKGVKFSVKDTFIWAILLTLLLILLSKSTNTPKNFSKYL